MDMYLQSNGSELNMTYWENRPAVLVIPGGSYTFIAQREGEPIALKFAAEGYQTFVLHYHTNSAYTEPLKDAVEAVREIRRHAAEWCLDPESVAVTGYSAGGNLALLLSVFADKSPDENHVSALPDALILGYPSVSGAGCSERFVDSLPELRPYFACSRLPPAFLWSTQDDETVPIAETLKLGQELNDLGVSLEMHIFPRGGHGMATADRATGRVNAHVAHWLPLAMEWLAGVFQL